MSLDIALITGLHMTLTWPIPGSFNIAFGEATVLFGILFVGTSLTLVMGWELLTLGIYGFFVQKHQAPDELKARNQSKPFYTTEFDFVLKSVTLSSRES